MPIKKEIIYPVMLECVQYCTDTFWNSVFEDLAYGKTPSGCYINKDYLCCSYKGKEFSYKIERKEPNILYNEIYSLLTEKLGILSHKEKIKKKILFYEMEDTLQNSQKEWGNIRKKNIKDSLYERYVIDMKKEHNLSIQDTKYLLAIVIIAVMLKVITSKDIVYANGRIQKIDGIDFDDGRIILKKELFEDISGEEFESEDDIPEINICTLSEHWPKFLALLKKQIIN